MKIGIVGPSPVPFCIGGAENLYWGLLNQINQHTPHQAELIKLPAKETGFWDLIAGYQRFSQLDLGHFDLVISTKYPAWMVHHDRHICYMLHRLRGLYDTYPLTGCPQVCAAHHAGVQKCLSFMQQAGPVRSALPELMDRLETLGRDRSVPADVFALPGPFVRTVIHYLDRIGLAPERITKFAAISRTVAERKDYFPGSAQVEVIYPPSNLETFACGEDDYLFTVSRLDGPKRISLLIAAMARVKADIRLKIAGTGPDEDRLRKMAGNDPRIEFLGFVKDHGIIDLYANALAVPYVPFDEDYGLVTIEAMMSGKPVLTTTDAGGPTEFVTDGKTGFCVPPDARALAEKIDHMCRNRDLCRQMGQKGLQLVRGITWENAVSRLLEEPNTKKRPVSFSQERKKLTVAATFPIYPPRGGGQSRVFHLYRHLAKWWDIEIVTFTNSADAPFKREIAPGLTEIRIPKTQAHDAQENTLSLAAGQVPVTDVAMPRLYALTPDYVKALHASAQKADVLVACHPYLVEALAACGPDKPLWYEAQDVEIDLKTKILSDSAAAQRMLEQTRTVEHRCWKEAQLVFACSLADLDRLARVYGDTGAVLLEVPNGVCPGEVLFTRGADRRALKKKLGLAGTRIVVFMGSWHGPNLEAVEHIMGFARQLPAVYFLIMGSCGLAFGSHTLPPNMGLAGVVEDDIKAGILAMADAAVNPMTSGSGTNLKMLEYFAAGVPVISTPFGTRGLGCTPGKELLVADIASFSDTIKDFFALPAEKVQQLAAASHALVTEKFDWAVIAANMHARISRHFS
ncbi:MAG: glycosyltransferase family 4 protein [Desulfotignum sp.]|jgi:glycosyltransferase involved in cell wall biosynthesis|nr:glycosyltransferase family 4 protein [Desulfotignum sp.]